MANSESPNEQSAPTGVDAQRIAKKIVREMEEAAQRGEYGVLEITIDIDEALRSPNRSRINMCIPKIVEMRSE